MGFTLAGALLICVTVFIVNLHKAQNIRPYFGAYTAVILTGFYGAVGFANFFIPMMTGGRILEAVINGALYLAGFKVMVWGLGEFKQLQMAS